MSTHQHEKINYVELPARDLEAVKAFFTQAFGWSFEDFGPDYTAFENEGLDGGFYRAEHTAVVSQGSALIIFYSQDLAQTEAKIKQAGGKILRPVFSFPGGRRFHFADPNGNEYAVWSDT